MRLSPSILFIALFASASAYAVMPGTTSRAAPKKAADPLAPTEIEADNLTGQKGKSIEATGNAILKQGAQTIRADKLNYQQDSGELQADGGVVVEEDGNRMTGPRLQYNMESQSGELTQPEFYFTENNARGSAEKMHIVDKQHYNLDGATYTTCPAGNDDWLLRMGNLDLDKVEQLGTATHAYVQFKGVPFVYTPWMDFPLTDARKSGFLSPDFGSTVKNGAELTLPYYVNIAPNYDATLAPRYMQKRGTQFNNELRYLGAGYNGEIHADTLQGDQVSKINRSHFAIRHAQAIGNGFSANLNFNRVADDAYFRDLGSAVATTSQINLLQDVSLNYLSPNWTAVARAQRYQTLQDPLAPIAVPYARLPQVTATTQRNWNDINVSLNNEFVAFKHPTSVGGNRMVVYPQASYPLVSEPAFYVTPKVGLHNSQYVLNSNNTTALPNATRSVPIVSLDSGVAFERETKVLADDYIQTLEPRAFYVYIPYRKQDLLPNFDSAQADFNFSQIFTENRFFGNDRIGDANQLTLATTTRIINQASGAERLKVTLAERFSFITPQVNLLTPANTSTAKSDVLMAVSSQASRQWHLDSEFQYNPNQANIQRYNLGARYRPEPGKSLNVSYRFLRNTTRMIDVSTQWPLVSKWYAVGRWNYSYQDSRLLDSIAGLEYNQDCWTLRLVAQHFTTALQQTNTGFFVQLELNDFLQVGSDPLAVLRKSVPGYSKLNDRNSATRP
ncbi:MAG: LPS-assembly protein LptD [Gallionella sp.]